MIESLTDHCSVEVKLRRRKGAVRARKGQERREQRVEGKKTNERLFFLFTLKEQDAFRKLEQILRGVNVAEPLTFKLMTKGSAFCAFETGIVAFKQGKRHFKA